MAERLKIITDSTADMPAKLIRELGVSVLPLKVRFGTECFRDRVDLTCDEFYKRLEGFEEQPTTSMPETDEFRAIYKKQLEKHDRIVSIHISSRLSRTVRNAAAAAADFEKGRITVVDSKLVSAGMMLVVVRAARAAQNGAGLPDILAKIQEDIANARLYFGLDTLDYLQRGGRIGLAGHFIGSLLEIKPVLTMRDGEIVTSAKLRSRRKAFKWILSAARPRTREPEIAAIGHSAAPDEADELALMIEERFPDLELLRCEIGPVVGTHAGLGCIGLALI